MHSPRVLSLSHKERNKASVHRFDNSFAEPLTNLQLLRSTLKRGDFPLLWEFLSHELGYAQAGGSLDLRTEIAELYGPAIGPDNIVTFTGAQIAIKTMAMTILDPDSHCIVLTPSYQSLQEAPLFAGSAVSKIPLRPENGWRLELSDVRKAMRPETTCLIINEPHNPTGRLMSAQDQARLCELASGNGMYILSDEVNRLLEYDTADRLPATAEIYPRGVSITTMSKSWGGGGMDVGWAVFQDLSLRPRSLRRMYFETVNNSRAGELQAIMALRASDEILGRNAEIVRRNLLLLDAFLEDHGDWFEWVRPRAGTIGFVKFKGPLSAEELAQELAEAGIAVKPASLFGDVAGLEQYFRIGFGEKAIPRALEALRAFVEERRAGWGG